MAKKKRDPKERREEAEGKVVAMLDTDKLRAAAIAAGNLGALENEIEVLRAKVLGLDGILSPAADGDDRSVWRLVEEITAALDEPLEKLQELLRLLDKIELMNPDLEDPDEDFS